MDASNPKIEINSTAKPSISNDEIERLLISTGPFIQSHVAIMALDDGSIFSGVYAKSFGYEGIITARHCAEEFLPAQHFSLIVSEYAHQLVVESEDFEYVRVGFDEYTDETTDLSFLIIHNQILLNLLKAKGCRFYDLDCINGDILKDVLFNSLHRINWCIAGSPNGSRRTKEQVIDGAPVQVIVALSAISQGSLIGYEMVEPFDYITIVLGCDFEDFPDSYKGMSGGGIWYQRFVTDDGKVFRVEPILAGIACTQSESTVKDGWKVRSVRGHGFFSIYTHLKMALSNKRRTA